MGIWSAWVPIGSTLMLILAPLSQGMNWQAVWWFGCLYALVVMALFLVFVKPAKWPCGERLLIYPPSSL